MKDSSDRDGNHVLHDVARAMILTHEEYSRENEEKHTSGVFSSLTSKSLNLPHQDICPSEDSSPISLRTKEPGWNLNEKAANTKIAKAQSYGGIGQLRPSLFQDNSLSLLFIQSKGGVGKTTHALNFATTACLDGNALWLQSGLWETGRQTGLRPFLNMTECDILAGRHLDLAKLALQENFLQMIMSPERLSDSLTDEEFERMFRIMARRVHVLSMDMGYFDIYQTAGVGARIRRVMTLSNVFVLVPWTGNAAAWAEAKDVARLLVEQGFPTERCWGIEIDESSNKFLLPTAQEIKEVFDERVIRIPYVEHILEKSFYTHTLPILHNKMLRDAYHSGLEAILSTWLKS